MDSQDKVKKIQINYILDDNKSKFVLYKKIQL